MGNLKIQKGCELHVHLAGCLYAEDLIELGCGIYQDVDWGLFTSAYAEAFGWNFDPVALFRKALGNGAAARRNFERHYVFTQEEGGNFDRFQAKLNLAICLCRHWYYVLQRGEVVLERITDRHKLEGLDYIEYRALVPFDVDAPDVFLNFHQRNAQTLQRLSRAGFTARYLVSLPRRSALESYVQLRRMLDECPELGDTVVGVDFCSTEQGNPPSLLRDFFQRLRQDNQERPDTVLEVVYHVGEVFFDKSLESAIRWCHEAAQMGARRLGHAIALGLDPAIAIERIPSAHTVETASERLAQLDYDLAHADELQIWGIAVDVDALQRERNVLAMGHPGCRISRPYDEGRIEDVRRRQAFVLARLAAMGTVVETCPSSNLRIGGIPNGVAHPVHRFLNSEVPLVIGADDPGIFNAPLSAEIDWVATHAAMDTLYLNQRLGDPRRFRLGGAF